MVCNCEKNEGSFPLKVIFITERGIEELLEIELKNYGKTIAKPFGFSGRVLTYFQKNETLLKALYTSSIYHRAYIVFKELLITGKREDLETFYWAVDESLIEFLNPSTPFAVKTVRRGIHLYSSQEVSAYVGASIIDLCKKKKGFRPTVNLKNPHLIVFCDVSDRKAVIGIELVGLESMHKRHWHIHFHPAGLKTTIANALILLSDWKKTEALCDPMCGSGTIPIEAAHRAIKLPAAYFRKNSFLFLKIGLWNNTWKEVTEEIDAEIDWKFKPIIYASDRSEKFLNEAIENARNALVKDKIRFFLCDIANPIPEILTLTKIFVTNPPYGIRMGNPVKAKSSLESLFRTFAESKAHVLVIIHPDHRLIESLTGTFKLQLDKKLVAYNGNVKVLLFRILKN